MPCHGDLITLVGTMAPCLLVAGEQTPSSHSSVAVARHTRKHVSVLQGDARVCCMRHACCGSSSVGSASLMTPDVHGTCGPTVGAVASGCACARSTVL